MDLFWGYLFGCQIVNIRNVSENTPKVCFIQLVFIALQSLKIVRCESKDYDFIL